MSTHAEPNRNLVFVVDDDLAHLHDCERQARRSHGCASIRLPRLPHKADLGEVVEGLAQESSGGARIKRSRCTALGASLGSSQRGLWDSVLKNNVL